MFTLTEERACNFYITNVLGYTNWAEDLARRLGDSTREFTSDSLMRYHFDELKVPIETFLANPDHVLAFQALYPTRHFLLEAGVALCESFDRLHSVRQAVISKHARPDHLDVHCHADDFEPTHDMSVDDLASIQGLTPGEFDTWKCQCNAHGYVYLSQAERDILRQAILAEFL